MSIRLKSKQWCYNGKYYKAALDRKLREQKQSRTKVCKECQKEALKVKWNFGSQKRGMKTTFEGEDVNHSTGKASPGNAEDSCSFEQLLKKKNYGALCVLGCYSHVQLCVTIYMDCSPPGSSVHRILQERIVPSSRGSSWPRDWTCVSYIYLDWQAGSLPLAPPGKPLRHIIC